jgi:hypothetical protein
VRSLAAGKVPSNRPAATPKVQQADIASLETELSEALGAKVAINHGRGGKGKLIIHYTDLDTLDGVLKAAHAPGLSPAQRQGRGPFLPRPADDRERTAARAEGCTALRSVASSRSRT